MSRPAIGRTSDGRTTELPAPLPSGLNLTVLVAGDGENYPQRSQSVAVHYDAYWNADRDWSAARKAADAIRQQQEEQDKQTGGDGGRLLLH